MMYPPINALNGWVLSRGKHPPMTVTSSARSAGWSGRDGRWSTGLAVGLLLCVRCHRYVDSGSFSARWGVVERTTVDIVNYVLVCSVA